MERKIKEIKQELEKLEEIRQIQEIQEKIETVAMEKGEKIEEPLWTYLPKTTFRHVVFSGGAAGGLYIYGALKTTHERGLWNYDDIKTVWGTSAGSMLAICLALKYEWSVLDEYLLKRPWNTVFKLNFMRLWNEKGLMGKEVIEEIMVPLFAGKGLKADITMGEFYKETGIEVHIFITELIHSGNEFCSLDISPKTHPEWRVMDAVYASSCLPLVFVPHEVVENRGVTEEEGKVTRRVFLDGGILAAFPFYHCIQSEEVDETEVLGFYLNKWENKTEMSKNPERTTDLFTFVKSFASAVFNYTDKTGRKPPVSEKACLVLLKMNIIDRFDMTLVHSEEKRREYISIGSRMCLDFLIGKGMLVPVSCSSSVMDSSMDLVVENGGENRVET